MRINSKKKGNRNERSGTKLWTQWTGWEFSRVPASGGLRWKKTDDITGDIICTEKGIYDFKFSIEMKFHQKVEFNYLLLSTKKDEVNKFWAQAKADGARGGKIPILFMRYNGMKADTHFVVISYPIYLKIRKLIKFSCGILKYNREFVIFNSEDLFKSDFHKIYQLL
jgi:Holliday junction resolvase